MGGLLGKGRYGIVRKIYHAPSKTWLAAKMIKDNFVESSDKKKSLIMDFEVPLRMGDKCPYLIKFYGALHAEVCYSIIIYPVIIEAIQLKFLKNQWLFSSISKGLHLDSK
jgi:hypothetical protein